MTAPPQLEDRLRAGLRAAAEAVPPAPDTIPAPDEQVVRLRSAGLAPQARSRRRRTVVTLATAAALAVVAGTAVVLTGDDGDADSSGDVTAESAAPTTTTLPPHEMRVVNGMVPGQAVAVDGKLTTYGPDGQPTGTVDLAPLGTIQNAVSDLQGGWVVCGGVYKTPEELNPEGVDPETAADAQAALDDAQAAAEEAAGTSTAPATTVPREPSRGSDGPEGELPEIEASAEVRGGWVDVLTWFPASGDPVELDGNVGFLGCSEGSIQVVDSPEGSVVLRGGVSFGESGGDMHPRLDGILLPTGERREYRVPDLPGLPWRWSLTTGKALTYIDGVGLQLFDLTTTEEIPIADIQLPSLSHLALAHDGKTAAVLTGPVSGPVDAIVYDLATGAELFRKSFDMSAEGDQLSYDGTTLAVGNFYDSYGPVTVIDLATGAEHTIDAHGIVL